MLSGFSSALFGPHKRLWVFVLGLKKRADGFLERSDAAVNASTNLLVGRYDPRSDEFDCTVAAMQLPITFP